MLPILLPGLYEGKGTIKNPDLGSTIPFKISWEVLKGEESRQEAIQTLHIEGADEPLQNHFTFLKGGVVHLVNSLLGGATGTWLGGVDHLSWELNHPPHFEGFELIRLGSDGELLFHAEYLSSEARNEIKGSFKLS